MAVLIGKTYRTKHAIAAQTGRSIPRVSQISFGSDGTAWTPDDTGLKNEIVPKKDIDSVSRNDLEVVIYATISGAEVGDNVLREIAYWDSEGDFVAREVIKAKEFESTTSMKIEAHLQF